MRCLFLGLQWAVDSNHHRLVFIPARVVATGPEELWLPDSVLSGRQCGLQIALDPVTTSLSILIYNACMSPWNPIDPTLLIGLCFVLTA